MIMVIGLLFLLAGAADGAVVPAQDPRCPSTKGLIGICVEECIANTACEGQQICCSNGCGHVCMPVPVVPVEDSRCPNTTGQFGICVDLCSVNQPCPVQQICCSNGCGHTCVTPSAERTTTTTAVFNPCSSGEALQGVFCGRGPTREDCPSSHTCVIDPLDRYAVCCPAIRTTTPPPTRAPSCDMLQMISCPSGQECVLQQVFCITRPCFAVPTCRDIKTKRRCKNLPAPENGKVWHFDWNSVQRAIFRCDRDFMLSGSSRRTCRADGTWSGDKTVCTCT